MASEVKTIWQASPSDTEKSRIKGFTDQSKQDSNKAVRSIAEFTKGGGGGAQSYPITVEATGGTVHFYTDSGEELTANEAPAGTVFAIVPKTSGGGTPSSGSMMVVATQAENSPAFIDATDFSREYAVAMPIGGLTVSVTING